MKLSNTFSLALPVEQAWTIFLDLERIAPCLPGAAITDVQGEEFHGGVKIKVGPISTQYHGVTRFVATDTSSHQAVISAKGKDVGGQGNVDATITATLTTLGEGTQVQVDTELELSGRAAQFGRGVVADVASRILGQFARNLEAEISSGALTGADPGSVAGPGLDQARPGLGPRPSLDDVEPLDVVGSLGGTIAKYGVPAVGAVVCLWLLARSSGRGTARRAFTSPVSITFMVGGSPTSLPLVGTPELLSGAVA